MNEPASFKGIPDVPGVTHRYVDANGIRMHVAEAGEGDPVLLLHGWPQHWWLWRKVIPPLAEHYRVIAPDLRGFGWSDAPKDGYDKREMAGDVLALIDALDVEQPIKLAGHDWGGWIGFLLAMRQPERFERYMALNIAPPWGDPGPLDPKAQLKAFSKLVYQVPLSTPGINRWMLAGGGRSRLKNGVIKATTNREAWADGSLDVFLDQFKEPARAAATMHLYRTFLTRELPQIALRKYVDGRLTVPTRMLFGAGDVAVSLDMVTADHSSMADDFSVDVVPDCGHFIVDEQPQLVAERMLAWFGANG
jgi:pimeloyl-ACP methyl ester carboxylesterase